MNARRLSGQGNPGEKLGMALVGALALAALIVPPAAGGFLPHQIGSYLIFGLFALSVGILSRRVKSLDRLK